MHVLKLLVSNYFHVHVIGCLQQNMGEPLKIDTIDSSSGVMLPYYDRDTGVVFLAGKVSLDPLFSNFPLTMVRWTIKEFF